MRDIERQNTNFEKIKNMDFVELLAKQSNYIADLERRVQELTTQMISVNGVIKGSLETAVENVNNAHHNNMAKLEEEYHKLNYCVAYITANDNEVKTEARSQLRKLSK